MTEDATVSRPVGGIVMPFDPTLENVLRRITDPHIDLANDFCIGLQSIKGWQVFYRGCDAAARLRLKRSEEHKPEFHETFFDAWNWISQLTTDDCKLLEAC